MTLLDDKTRLQVREALAPITTSLELVVYTAGRLVIPGRDAPGQQEETIKLLGEIAELNDQLKVVQQPLATDEKAAELGITLAPTTLLRESGSNRTNIRFIGFPGGYEFATLIEAILLLGKGESGLSETGKETLTKLTSPVQFRSFVTPTCPYCPRAVLTGYRFAMHSPHVIAAGIEANEFPGLAQKYRISSVPDTIIEGTHTERVLGGQLESVFVEALLKAAALEPSAGA